MEAEMEMCQSEEDMAIEKAMFTLSRFLPVDYPTDSHANILLSTIDYVENLSEWLRQNSAEAIKEEEPEPSAIQQQPTFNSAFFDPTNMSWTQPDDFGYQMEMELKLVIDEDTFSDLDEADSDVKPAAYLDEKLIKRPSNGFIRFSAEKRREMHEMFPNSDNREISRCLGVVWKNMSYQERHPYIDQFYEEMQNLKAQFPDWNYAGSRAKTYIRGELAKQAVLPTRLRPRRHYALMSRYSGSARTTAFTLERRKRKKKRKSVMDEERDSPLTTLWVQCDLCAKWRKLPSGFDPEQLSKFWFCQLNPNMFYNSCHIDQEKQ